MLTALQSTLIQKPGVKWGGGAMVTMIVTHKGEGGRKFLCLNLNGAELSEKYWRLSSPHLCNIQKPQVLQIIGIFCHDYFVFAKTTPRSCHNLWLTLSANLSRASHLTLLSEEHEHGWGGGGMWSRF